uniref:prepilin peptidase n=1 Tax=Ndongobacter massiliensis TaxID=1871025 RepID=UPI000931B187|nr:prepilin peptidase [Ndongobacter massiliensis]
MNEFTLARADFYARQNFVALRLLRYGKQLAMLLLFVPFFFVLLEKRAYAPFQAVQIVCYLDFLLYIACYDARRHRIPNRCSAALAAAGLAHVLLFFSPAAAWRRLLFAGALGTTVLLFACVFSGFGMGDAKLLIGMALVEGIHLFESLLIGFLFCFFSALFTWVKTRNRAQTLPFAPYLFFGAYVSIAMGG